MAKEKIVVIDDSPIVRKLAELALEEEGYKVYTAEDGEEGLRICEEVRPSVILVDFIMPRISGYQFCEAARDNELLKDIPIILITGKGEDVGKKFAEKFGVVDYFIKPFKSEILVEKVNAIIYAQKMQAEEGVAYSEPGAAVFESSDVLGQPEYQERSFYGAPDVPSEPVTVVEPVYSASDMGYAESSVDEFKYKEDELSPVSHDDTLSQPEEIQPVEPVASPEGPISGPAEMEPQPEEVISQPEEIFGQAGYTFDLPEEIQPVAPVEPVALSDYAFTPPSEMLVEPEGAPDEGGKDIPLQFPGPYEFKRRPEFASVQALDSDSETKAEYQPDRTVEEALDSVIRRYFNDELPYLIEKNMEDILRRYGIIKDSSILLSGDLGSIPCIEVLKLVDTQKLTGKFSAYSQSGSAEIYFENGEVVYALTSKQGGTLTSKRIAIIKKGAQNEAGDRSMEGITDAILAVMDFNDGGFFFERMMPPRALLDLSHHSNVMALVLQGLRNKGEYNDEGSKLRESSIPVRAISDGFARNVGMNSQEIDVFLSIDGTNSVADISGSSELGVVEVARILSRLEKAGIVAEREGF
jgi:CheY-like chemotaxis protein